MRFPRPFSLPILALTLLSALAAAPASPSAGPAELVVRVAPALAGRLDLARGAWAPAFGDPAADALLTAGGAVAVRPVLRFAPRSADVARRHGLDRIYLVRLAPDQDATVAREVLAASPLTEAVEIHGACRLHGGSPGAAVGEDPAAATAWSAPDPALVPDDPLYPSQWMHDNQGQVVPHGGGGPVGVVDCDLDTDLAWEITTGDPGVIVAVLDSGVDTAHPEFAGRLLPGWDFIDNDADPHDEHGHGTGCAGIIGAAGNNGQGVAGIAWQCRILPVRVGDADGAVPHEAACNGMVHAADQGATVITMSFGNDDPSGLLESGIAYARDLGCILVAARGNDDDATVSFPASYADVIAVGALSPCDERVDPLSCDGETWWGSSYGSDLDFLAPGVRMPTTDILGPGGAPGDYVTDFNGTSAAAPCVAGVAALVCSARPDLDADQVRRALQLSCEDVWPPGWDSESGHGRINAAGALTVPILAPPQASAMPATVAVQLPPDGQTTTTLTIANVAAPGSADLHWHLRRDAAPVVLALPGPDPAARGGGGPGRPVAGAARSSRADASRAASSAPGRDQLRTGDEARPVPVALPARAVASDVSLVLDDGTRETSYGYVSGGQLLWLNRFTPAPGVYPFTLTTVAVVLGPHVAVGSLIDLHVYEDTDGDGDPATGAVLRASLTDAPVQEAGAETFSLYEIPPTIFSSPGDVLIAVVNRTCGMTPGEYPAAMDQTTCAGRSYLGGYADAPPPDPPTLPPDGFFDLMTDGNWMVRGYGVSGEYFPWLQSTPEAGVIPAGGATDVTLTFSAAGLTPDTYTCELLVVSDDPQQPELAVPVSLVVAEGAPPCLAVDPAALTASVPSGGSTTRTLTVANTAASGSEPLVWNLAHGPAAVTLTLPGSSHGEARPAGRGTDLLAASGSGSGGRTATWPAAREGVDLVLDDGSRENSLGLTSGGQFLWLNRFTPDPSQFPLVIEEVAVLFGADNGVAVGEEVDVYVYADPDGDPGTGAVHAGSIHGAAVQAVDDATFSVWPTGGITLPGPGDVLVGVVNRTAGLDPDTFPAALDQTTTAGRSWIGTYSGPPGDPPDLPAPGLWGVIDDYGYPGNWMIRAHGTGGDPCAWLGYDPAGGSIPAGAESQVAVTFTGDDLADGTYACELHLTCNDPQQPAVTIPVTFDVGATPVADTPPEVTVLAQNAPNPFNPRTRIALVLPRAGHVRLGVYTVSGQLVRTLVDGVLAAGPHEVVWDGRHADGRAMASGVYLCRLRAGAQEQTRRMTLLR